VRRNATESLIGAKQHVGNCWPGWMSQIAILPHALTPGAQPLLAR
jgi:hypothetical protein